MLRISRSIAVLAVVASVSTGILGWAGPASAVLGDPGGAEEPKTDPRLEDRSFRTTLTVDGKPAGSGAGQGYSGPTRRELSAQKCRETGLAYYCMIGPDPVGTESGSPAAAAQQVVASMDLHVPDIGLAPRPTTADPDSVGLVGVPNYMWVANPEIFQTVSSSAAIDPWTITVSGRVAWVDWDMGDGQVIRCTGPGTPYEARFDLDPSPDCGHVYSVQGYYTVAATARWELQWSGGGQSGTIVTDRTSTAPIVIGEAYALRRK